MPSSAERPGDAWQNHGARALLADLADRSIAVTVRSGRLDVRPASRLADADVFQLRAHKPDLLVLVLVCDDRTLDRLLDFRAGRLPAVSTAQVTAGHCHTCGALLHAPRRHGRCGWCALAVRLHCGAPLSPALLHLFGDDVGGLHAVRVPTGALPFDVETRPVLLDAVPA